MPIAGLGDFSDFGSDFEGSSLLQGSADAIEAYSNRSRKKKKTSDSNLHNPGRSCGCGQV